MMGLLKQNLKAQFEGVAHSTKLVSFVINALSWYSWEVVQPEDQECLVSDSLENIKNVMIYF